VNSEAEKTFSDIMGVNTSALNDVFVWLLLLTLGFMLLIILKNSANQRNKDPDYEDIDVLFTILRAAALMFILLLIFT
jgi:hypothetical protein